MPWLASQPSFVEASDLLNVHQTLLPGMEESLWLHWTLLTCSACLPEKEQKVKPGFLPSVSIFFPQSKKLLQYQATLPLSQVIMSDPVGSTH